MIGPCIEWDGTINRDGYGPHRRIYQEKVGPVPSSLELDHLCRNRACINTDHLEPVTHAENMRRSSEAKTHCKNGHEFTPENSYPRRYDGRRCCRACNRRAVTEYKQRRKTA